MKTVIVAVALVCLPAAMRAQDARGRGAAPAPAAPRNLQVLPKDTPAQDVIATMQQFTRGLGVQCTYCHVEQAAVQLSVEELLAQQQAAAQAAQQAAAQPAAAGAAGGGRGRGRGRGGPQMDYASDEKRQKLTARVMLAMTNDINARLAASLKKPVAEIQRVQCQTCHRGITNPKLLPDLLRTTMTGKGEGAAVAQYRELRHAYLTTGTYDFSEPVLLELGRESLATKKPDDALAWLQLSVEFFPKSVPSYIELSRAHAAKRDRDAAVADLNKALALDPANAAAKQELARVSK